MRLSLTQTDVRQQAIAAISGILFGFGLGLSQMVDRQRVLGFLDVLGQWDPTLLFVLGGAVTVTVITFRFVLRQPHPWFAGRFELPTRRDIDGRLLAGAAIFGIGWGICGYCPGPGVAAIALGMLNPILFLAAFLLGSWVYRRWLS
jgi:uncharacterized membrane protein YedE/YeeE